MPASVRYSEQEALSAARSRGYAAGGLFVFSRHQTLWK